MRPFLPPYANIIAPKALFSMMYNAPRRLPRNPPVRNVENANPPSTTNAIVHENEQIESSSSFEIQLDISSEHEPNDNNALLASTTRSLIEELLDFDTTLKPINEWLNASDSKPLILTGDANYALAITLTNKLHIKKTRCSLSDWNWKYIIRSRRLNIIDERVSSTSDYNELIDIWKENPSIKIIILPSCYTRMQPCHDIVVMQISDSRVRNWDWYRWCKEMEDRSLITIRYWTVEESLEDRHIRDARLKSHLLQDDNL